MARSAVNGPPDGTASRHARAVRSGQDVGRPRRPASGLGLRRLEIAGPQREPELHPVETAREVPTAQLLDLAHPVPERVGSLEPLSIDRRSNTQVYSRRNLGNSPERQRSFLCKINEAW